jgi:hypothetical protein
MQVIPCSVEKFLQFYAMDKDMADELGEKKERWCQGCREVKPSVEEGGKALVRCKGCESVRYCGKVSFSSLKVALPMSSDSRIVLIVW